MNTDSNSLIIQKGAIHFLGAIDCAWSINVPEVRKRLAEFPQADLIIEDDQKTLRFPVRPLRLTIKDQETVKVEGLSSDTDVTIRVTDMGVIAVELKFNLAGCDLPRLRKLSHSLDEDNNGILRDHCRKLLLKVTECIKGQISDINIAGDFAAYRTFIINEVSGDAEATSLLHYREDLAHILRGELNNLADEQIEDALKVAISYHKNDRVIIDSRNAVLLGKSSFPDETTVITYTVIEALELKVLEYFLKNMLEAGDSEQNGIGKFRLKGLQRIEQDVAIQLGRITNPLDLNADQYFADLRELTAKRLGLSKWAEEVKDKLSVVREISNNLHERKMGRLNTILEALIVAMFAYEVFPTIIKKFF